MKAQCKSMAYIKCSYSVPEEAERCGLLHKSFSDFEQCTCVSPAEAKTFIFEDSNL